MINVDGDGFLVDPNDWNEDVMYDLAKQDGVDLDDKQVEYILAAREIYSTTGVVPPIRVFAALFGMDRKAKPLYDLFKTGPMKRICKWGGLPKPTGCV